MRNPNRRRLAAPAFVDFFSIDTRLSSSRVVHTDALKPCSDQESGAKLFAQPTRGARSAAEIAPPSSTIAREPGCAACGSEAKGPLAGPFLELASIRLQGI